MEKPVSTSASEISENTVEIQSGREVVARVRQYAEELRADFMPFLPLGVKTKEYFGRVLDVIIEDPDRIEANPGNVTNFYSFNALSNRPQDELPDAKISIGMDYLDRRFEDLTGREAWPLNSGDTRDLIYRGVVWHELGHGVQASFANVAPRKSKYSPEDLSEKTYEEMGDYADWPDGQDFSSSGTRTIESERFAEGFSRMLLREWLTQEHGARIADNVLGHMYDYRLATATDSLRAYTEYNSGPQDVSLTQFMKERGVDGGVNRIGYSNPHSTDGVMTIMAKTREWELEDMPLAA